VKARRRSLSLKVRHGNQLVCVEADLRGAQWDENTVWPKGIGPLAAPKRNSRKPKRTSRR